MSKPIPTVTEQIDEQIAIMREDPNHNKTIALLFKEVLEPYLTRLEAQRAEGVSPDDVMDAVTSLLTNQTVSVINLMIPRDRLDMAADVTQIMLDTIAIRMNELIANHYTMPQEPPAPRLPTHSGRSRSRH